MLHQKNMMHSQKRCKSKNIQTPKQLQKGNAAYKPQNNCKRETLQVHGRSAGHLGELTIDIIDVDASLTCAYYWSHWPPSWRGLTYGPSEFIIQRKVYYAQLLKA